MIEIKMPEIGMAMDEGQVSEWNVKVGDIVESSHVLGIIESDKVSYELKAPEQGEVVEVLVPIGHTVPTGTVLLRISQAAPGSAERSDGATRGGATNDNSGLLESEGDILSDHVKSDKLKNTSEKTKKISPRARKLAIELGLDLRVIPLRDSSTVINESYIMSIAKAQNLENRQQYGSVGSETSRYTAKPLSAMRKAIAKRMVESIVATPHFYLTMGVMAEKLLEFKNAETQRLSHDGEMRYTVTDVLCLFVARELGNFPLLNAVFADDEIREWNTVNIGLVVSVENGLFAPVLRQQNLGNLKDIAIERIRLVKNAKARRLMQEESENATFTISNLGMYGVESFTSIINSGQSAILSVGGIHEKVIHEHGKLVTKPFFKLTLGVDHRVADGVYAARFLVALKQTIENIVL